MEDNEVYSLSITYDEQDEEQGTLCTWWDRILAVSKSKEKLEKMLLDQADSLFDTFDYLTCDTITDKDAMLMSGYSDDKPDILVTYTLLIQKHTLI